MKKKLISSLLAISMLASLGATAFAQGTDLDEPVNGGINTPGGSSSVPVELNVSAATFSVTVPSKLPITVNGEGSVIVATDVKITNNGHGKVEVKNLELTTNGGWTLNSMCSDFVNMPVNSKVLGMSFNGKDAVEGDLESTFPIINAESSQAFTYNAKLAPQSEEIFSENIASAVFTIGWSTSQNGANAVLEGDGQTYHKMAPSTLSFRSTAPLDEFQEVLVNGEVVDPSNYTLTEGSTIVTLSIDYLETLNVDSHEITVVSDSGSPSAGFNVVEPELNGHGFYYNQPYTAHIDAFGGKFALFVRTDGTADIINVSNGVPDTITYELDGNTVVVHTDNGTFRCIIANDGSEIYCAELGATFVLGDESIVADEDFIYIFDESLNGYVVYTINRRQSSYHAIKTGVNGLPTVKLGDFMFEDNTDFIIPKIPDSVTIFGDYIFSNCSNLTNVEIPDSVITLGAGLFSGCENLQTIKIGSGLKNVEDTTFWGSYRLNKIIVSPDNRTYHSSGNCLIETNTKTLILGSNNSTIPMDGSVKTIGRYAFLDCKQMTSIVIPDGVEDMEYGAFNGCTNLKSIYFGKDIKNIGETIFYYCPSISDISVSPDNSVYYSAGNCVIKADTNTIVLGGNNSVIPVDERIDRIGQNAFRGRTISHIEIPDNIKYIGSHAFAECKNLISIRIPKNIVYFEGSIFADCSNLTDISFDGTMEEWNSFAKNVFGGNPWNTGVPATQVVCSDGVVELS